LTYKPRDHFYKKAKKENYRARSVYKLKEINEKFRVIKKGDSVFDLGSCPGSWLQYILEVVREKGSVVGVDIAKIKGKITSQSNFKFVNKSIFDLSGEDFEVGIGFFDVITSDMAPATTGIKDVDSQGSYELSLAAFEVCKSRLKKNGNFICKIFQSEHVREFVLVLKKYFKEVKQYRPGCTRKISSEIFIICKNYCGQSFK